MSMSWINTKVQVGQMLVQLYYIVQLVLHNTLSNLYFSVYPTRACPVIQLVLLRLSNLCSLSFFPISFQLHTQHLSNLYFSVYPTRACPFIQLVLLRLSNLFSFPYIWWDYSTRPPTIIQLVLLRLSNSSSNYYPTCTPSLALGFPLASKKIN